VKPEATISGGGVRPARSHNGESLSRHQDLSGLLDQPGMQVVVHGISKDPNAKLAMLLIPAGASRPTLAAKVPLTDAAARNVAGEHDLLVELHDMIPYPTLGSIPRVMDVLEFEGREVLVISAVPGTPMTTLYHTWRHTAKPSRVAADFAAVYSWLAAFQQETAGPRKALDMDQGTVDALRRRFPGDHSLEEVVAELERIYARLRKSQTPRTAVHGDLWCGNLLMADGAVSGVVDWEAGTTSGEPVYDLVHFALTYALYLDRHTRPGRPVSGHGELRAGVWGAGIEYAIDGQGWFPGLFREFIREGLGRLGADPECWRDAALAGIARIAARTDHDDFARSHLHVLHRLMVDKEADQA
jgi:aminoglycoside phosphotransferase